MKFVLIDKITEIQLGTSIKAIKNLSLAEEYLADHFPTFPVLPGVLMLEAMVQTAAYLVRATEDFKNSVIVLRGAKNVSYGNFVTPGCTMQVQADAMKIEGSKSTFKTQCTMDGGNVVRARLELAHYNLVDRNPAWKDEDERLIEHFRRHFRILGGPAALKS